MEKTRKRIREILDRRNNDKEKTHYVWDEQQLDAYLRRYPQVVKEQIVVLGYSRS